MFKACYTKHITLFQTFYSISKARCFDVHVSLCNSSLNTNINYYEKPIKTITACCFVIAEDIKLVNSDLLSLVVYEYYT